MTQKLHQICMQCKLGLLLLFLLLLHHYQLHIFLLDSLLIYEYARKWLQKEFNTPSPPPPLMTTIVRPMLVKAIYLFYHQPQPPNKEFIRLQILLHI